MAPALPLFVHSSIDDSTDLTPNAMRVLMHLARRADNDGVAWPSYQAIGDHCFISISDNAATRKTFARKAIDELVKAGQISKESRERPDGGQSSNGYRLLPVESDPVPIKHPPVLNNTPVLNNDAPCLISTPHAYEGTKGNPIEGSPKKVDDGDEERGRVFTVWAENFPGTMTPLLAEKINDLIDECKVPSVLYGINAAVEASARNFSYVAACARNHSLGKDPPVRPNQRAPSRERNNATSRVAASLSAIDEYEALKASHGVTS